MKSFSTFVSPGGFILSGPCYFLFIPKTIFSSYSNARIVGKKVRRFGDIQYRCRNTHLRINIQSELVSHFMTTPESTISIAMPFLFDFKRYKSHVFPLLLCTFAVPFDAIFISASMDNERSSSDFDICQINLFYANFFLHRMKLL